MKKSFLFSLFLIFSLLLCIVKGIANEKKSHSQKSSGKFTVKGTLLYEDHIPASGIDVFVYVVNEKGIMILTIPNHNGLHDEDFGTTDEKGKFEFKVGRKYFEGDKIRFTLCIDLKHGVTISENRLRGSKGIPLDIIIDYKTAVVNFDEIFGPITIRKRF